MTDHPTPSQLDNAAILAATETFVNTFVDRHRRERYHILIHRGDFIHELHHNLEQVLDERYRVILTGAESLSDGIIESIKKITNSTEAFLVGGPGHVHPGRRLPFEEAVEECSDPVHGALVLLDGGTAAYFDPEWMGKDARCVLTRDPKALKALRQS